MRILILSQYFAPEEFRINDLVRELVRRGHTVDVLTGLPNYPHGSFFPGYSWRGPSEESWHGARIIRSWIWPRGTSGSITSILLNYTSFILFAHIKGLKKLKGPYDNCLVFSTSPITSALPGIFLKSRLKYRLHIWVQDLWPESIDAVNLPGRRFFKFLASTLVRYIYRHCDSFLIQAHPFRESLIKYGAEPENIHFAPNWADVLIEKGSHSPECSLALSPEHFNIVFAGNIGRAQAMPTILAAAQRLKANTHVKWHIVGDGSVRDHFEREIKAHGLEERVILHPRMPEREMPNLFAQADALLVTLRRSPTLSLTVPSKVQAYMASGRPILAALDGEAARLINLGQAGLVCSAEDDAGLANIVEELSQYSRAAREAMGLNGRKFYAENFSQEHVIDRIEKCLDGGDLCA